MQDGTTDDTTTTVFKSKANTNQDRWSAYVSYRPVLDSAEFFQRTVHADTDVQVHLKAVDLYIGCLESEGR